MGYNKKVCVECKKVFVPTHIRENHCSDKCRVISIRKSSKKWMTKVGRIKVEG